MRTLQQIWSFLRYLVDDDAYDRYLSHWTQHHASEGAPMNRKQFFKMLLDHKWNGIRRCC